MSAALCGCGCGQVPEGNRTYVNNAHKQRAYRDRKRERTSTTCTANCPARGYCKQHDRVNRPARPFHEETTGGGGKRVRYWDPDHAGKPGLWDRNHSAPCIGVDTWHTPESKAEYLDRLRKQEHDRIERKRYAARPAGRLSYPEATARGILWPGMGQRCTPRVERSGVEALRIAAKQPGLSVGVGRDGWVTISQAAPLEVVELPERVDDRDDDVDELEQAA
jgi:hypothetical protein